ncbi:Major Facilitator Superfamily protein [Paenibacillus sp. UNC496MF]|nr:Major Facilitator Superfamily protein [Paenibacillus sp. UNC496MF]
MTDDRPAPASSLLRNRFVQTIVISTLFLEIGIWVRNIAILLYVKHMTNDDAFAVSLISVAEFAPIFAFSFVGGALADRWRPKRTMVGSDLLSAASILAILAAMALGSWRAVFFATLVSSILSQFSQPASMKLFKLYVPERLLQKAMSLHQTMFAVFMIFGPVIGMFVYQRFGIETSIGIMGIAFLLSAATLSLLPRERREAETQERRSVREDIRAGFAYIRSSPVLRKLGGGFFAVGFGLGLIQPMGIFLITERLGRPEEALQWFSLVNGAAMVVGGVLAMAFASKIAPAKLMTSSMAIVGLTIMGMGLTTNYTAALAFQFASGLVIPSVNAGINTLMLQHTEDAFLGRVNGFLSPLFTGSMVVTMMLSSVVMTALSLVSVYVLAGLFILAGAVVLLPLIKLKAAAAKPELENALGG